MENLKIKFKVSLSFYALTFFMLLLRQSFIFALYIIAVVLHEFAHYFVAKKLGYKSSEIVLSAFGAVLYGKFDFLSYKDEIKIALAGPLLNIALSILCVALWWLFPPLYAFTEMFAYANMFIGFINLLPCYPLDGGRVFMAIVNRKKSDIDTLKIVQVLGIIFSLVCFAFFFISLFFVPNFSLGLFGLFLFMGGLSIVKENMYKRIMFKQSIDKRIVKGIEKRFIVVNGNITLYQLIKLLSNGFFYEVDVIDEKYKLAGTLNSLQIDELMNKVPLSSKLFNVLNL